MPGVSRRIALLALVLGAAACSDDPAAQPAPSAAPAVTAAPFETHATTTPATTPITTPATIPATIPATVPATSPPNVGRVEVNVGVGPETALLSRELDASHVAADPFDEFAACSGLQDSVGTWSLQISQPGQEMSAVSILTVPPVSGAGDYEATFRLEWNNGAGLDAHGSVHLDPGLQSGTFVSDDFDVHGSFRCEGAARPEPLGAAAIEVYALMRRGTAQRIVSLAASSAASGTVCSADRTVPVEVVTRSQSGAISAFAIGGTDRRLAIRVGGTDLALRADAIQTSPGPGAGTFHAETIDGTIIDGAYRCT